MDTACAGFLGDREYTFFLPMARVIAFEREAECSIFELFHNLGTHLGSIANEMVLAGPSPARLKQCHSLIRNALIGGGVDEGDEVRELISTYCYPARPAVKDMALAWMILKAAIYGIDVVKKNSDRDAE